MAEAKAEKAKAEKKPNIFKRIASYFRDLRSEFKKVTWPTRKQVINNTIVVIVTIVIASIVICGLDSLLSLLNKLLLNQL